MNTSFPERIGRYRVVSLLGHGAMGNVFLAEDPLLKRKLAIKVVRIQGEEGDRTLERFEREAQISARLSHPNIITIFDVGQDPGVGIFLAMEYIQGTSLATFVREKRPTQETGLFILLQAMRALQAAAEAGIVHRDIKPENMMVSDQGRLKLMDFGLARGEDNRLTATGVFMGTPSFTAPELLLGKEPTVETDRYAFAVTAFEVLLGQLPFPGNNLGVTLYKIVHDPPLFPEGTPPGLAAAFTKALAKVPQERHSDLHALMKDLILACPIAEPVRRKLLGFLEPELPGEALAADPLLEAPRTPSHPPERTSGPNDATVVPQSGPAASRPPIASQPAPSAPRPAPKPPSVPPLLKLSLPSPAKASRPSVAPKPGTPRPSSPIQGALHGGAPKPAVGAQAKPVQPGPRPPSTPPVPKVQVSALPLPKARPVPKAAPAASPAPGPASPAPPRPPEPVAVTPDPALLDAALVLEEDAFEDDPFAGLDWDEILKPLPTASEHLYHELEDDLAAMELGDVLRAGDHIAAEELVNELERDLADTAIPELEAPARVAPPASPKRKPATPLPPPPLFPKLR